MTKLLGFIAGLLVFLGWLSLVGNPHVVETVIGLIIGIISGYWVHSKLKKLTTKP